MKADTGGGGKYHIVAEINMVPLIDVSLVLLIIFMVMTPMLVKSQVQVNLPKVSSVTPTDEPPAQVQVTNEGSFFVNDQRVLQHDLPEALTKLFQDPSAGALLIQADKEVPFERVVEVMDAARKAGIKKMGVAVVQKSGN